MRSFVCALLLTAGILAGCTVTGSASGTPGGADDTFVSGTADEFGLSWEKVEERTAEWEKEEEAELERAGRPITKTELRGDVRRTSPKLYSITLNHDFVEKYKNRLEIDCDYRVVHAGSVHSASQDGDLHVAGISDEVGLVCVAELMNAKEKPSAVAFFREAGENGDPFQMRGVWRVWCEHPGKPQVQNDPFPPITNSNPDHVFEVHPVTRIGETRLADTLRPIPGYDPKEARRAFEYYEGLRCHLEVDWDARTTTIQTQKAGYNYVEFVLEAEETDHLLAYDGRFVRSTVFDLQGKVVVKNRRMAFVRGSKPEALAAALKKGQRLHVLGMPRINLAIVSWRARLAQDRPEALDWDLPYEIVVVGVYE